MIASVKHTINYFQAPANYFWQWAEHATVIEWKNGTTICYTEDLATLMRAVTGSGVPSFGSILLVLAACNDNWSSSNECIGILHGLKNILPSNATDSSDDELDYYINKGARCMDMIASLEPGLRKGAKRAHLLHELFKDQQHKLKEEEIRDAVDELVSGRLDSYLFTGTYEITRKQYKEDLETLVHIYRKFSSKQQLERRLMTGIFEMPAPVPIELPESKPENLLEELATDFRTFGIANLTKRIIAALNIPMHSQGSSDQPLGGISDITNRGNLDRLLLSELAYDDSILLARLANNESLYLRREEPPDTPKTKRVILVDSTIKMWGLPRIFAMSAAVACSLNTKHKEEVESKMLNGTEVIDADISRADGILDCMQVLDHSLDCSVALQKYFSSAQSVYNIDTILICNGEFIHSISFQKLLSKEGLALSYIIAVNRNGELVFHEVVNARLKVLSKAKFDLEELLFAPKPIIKRKRETEGLPAFLQRQKSPLLFPSAGLRLMPGTFYYNSKLGVVTITETQRLLYFPSKHHGAIELLQYVEPGMCTLSLTDNGILYLAVSVFNSPAIVFYVIDVAAETVTRNETIAEKRGTFFGAYHEGSLYVRYAPDNKMVDIYNWHTGKFEGHKNFNLCAHVFAAYDKSIHVIDSTIKRQVNNGYNTLHRLKAVGISLFDQLSFDNKIFSIPDATTTKISIRTFDHKYKCEAEKDEESLLLLDNDHCRFTRFTWNDGSKAIIDSRGLMHLVSSDASLPEVTLVLVQGRTIACWSSDDTVAGNNYFIPSDAKTRLAPIEFHRRYLSPIIKRINEACS